MGKTASRNIAILVIGFFAGTVIGPAALMGLRVNAQAAPVLPVVPFTPQMRIGGNLYLQTSAEYHAVCLQTFRTAADRLQSLVKKNKIAGKRPAVIMDLDETVFDNSSFQTYLYLSGQDYTPTLWANYESNFAKDVTLIPGAKQFIADATSQGVEVVFLSNRLQKYQTSTISALERLGIAGDHVADRLFLRAESDPSDKTGRRDRIGQKYNVVALIGDNLRDFSELFVNPTLPSTPAAKDILSAVDHRKQEVERAADRWGHSWFILPNPVYGEWDRLIQVDPISLMHPTSIPVGPG